MNSLFGLGTLFLSLAAGAAHVDPVLLAQLREQGEAEMLVLLRPQADTSPALQLASKEERGRWVTETLRSVAEVTQKPVLELLQRKGAPARSFWIVNMVWTKGDERLVQALAQLPEVAKVLANPRVPLARPPLEATDEGGEPRLVEWGLARVGAPSVWALGYQGQGVVVGGQDTGYSWTHPALKGKYRGWDGNSADHNYNWHDAIHSGGGVCGSDSPFPCDDDGHGTHTMGTMVGDDGAGNQIGMAPQAKWIGCRNMDQGVGTPATYAECFQWFVAPTDLSGQNPDPSKAPHVINNSWGCPPSEGCTDPTILQAVVENVRNAGIVVVVSAGNSGPACASVEDPPAIYHAAFSVGATSSSDTIASFSSRGPVTVDGSGRLKPDISAPGVSIRSSLRGGGYGTMSGTSMAGPHVAGAVALLLSAKPSLKGQVSEVGARLAQTASHAVTPTGQVCGGLADNVFPNNTYGSGRLDVLAAVSEADLSVTVWDAPDPVNLGSTLTYTVQVANQGPLAASSVTLVATLHPSLTFIGSNPACSASSGTVTCSLGSLAAGSVALVQVNVTPTSPGNISSQFAASAATQDLTPSNNQVSETTGVLAGQADLEASLVPANASVVVGRSFSLTLGARNSGSAMAENVVASLPLPSGLSFVGGALACSLAGGTVTCRLGTLLPGAQAQRTVNLLANPVGTYTLGVDVTTSSPEGNLDNNHAQASLEVLSLIPHALVFDDGASGNGVWEPGETLTLRFTWANPSAQPTSDTGTASGFTGPPGAVYTLADNTGVYPSLPANGQGSCTDCYLAQVEAPSGRPQLHWDATLTETLTGNTQATWLLHLGWSFGDVPPSHWAYRYVESLLHSGVTAGCGGQSYCPASPVTRWQMATFLARALTGGLVPSQGSVPGLGEYNCQAGGTSLFADVSPTHPGCPGVHYVAAQGIAAGCGGGNFCPQAVTTRAQMAVFLARALVGSAVPASGTVPGMGTYQCGVGGVSLFADVDPQDARCPHVHFLAAQGISKGCGGGNFCPNLGTKRDQMAVFLSRAFNLTLFSAFLQAP